MTITLDLAPDVEAFLRNQATRGGQDVEAVAQAILAEAMVRDVVSKPGVSLADYGISPAQAAELRASFATFAGEWKRPEMDVYIFLKRIEPDRALYLAVPQDVLEDLFQRVPGQGFLEDEQGKVFGVDNESEEIKTWLP